MALKTVRALVISDLIFEQMMDDFEEIKEELNHIA
jgi:hypothetical protein